MSDILSEARPRNAELGVTGVLTAVDGNFLQIIEGQDSGIETLLTMLARDRRHADLVILDRRIVTARAFGDWEMVSPRLAADEISQLSRLLSKGTSRIDDFIPVLLKAVARQDAILEGRESLKHSHAPMESSAPPTGDAEI